MKQPVQKTNPARTVPVVPVAGRTTPTTKGTSSASAPATVQRPPRMKVKHTDAALDQDTVLLMERINKKFGPQSIFLAGDVDLTVQRISTGLSDLDRAIIGFPLARVVELYGMNMSAKTSLAMHLMSRFTRCLFIDAEGTFDLDRAELFGCRRKNILVQKPTYAEQAFQVMFEAAEMGIPLIVIDSIPALVPRREYDEEDMEKAGKIGLLAGFLARKLPKLVHICERTGTSILIINQVRSKFGVLFGDPYDTPGGHALKHYESMRLYLTRKQWLNHPKLGTFGQITKIKVAKSKVSKPLEVCELMLLFDRGFIEFDALDMERKLLLKNPPARPVFAEIDEDDDGETTH